MLKNIFVQAVELFHHNKSEGRIKTGSLPCGYVVCAGLTDAKHAFDID